MCVCRGRVKRTYIQCGIKLLIIGGSRALIFVILYLSEFCVYDALKVRKCKTVKA